MDEMQHTWGKLTSIDLKDCSIKKITLKSSIYMYIVQLCKLIDMQRFGNPTIVHFGADDEISGYSFVQLIETSLVSGHFSNRYSAGFIDIFSCKDYDHEEAARFTRDYFKAQSYTCIMTPRKC